MIFLFNWMILRFQPLIFTGVCQKIHEINSLSSPRPRRRVVSFLHRGRCLVLWAPPREPGAGTLEKGHHPTGRFFGIFWIKSFDLHQSDCRMFRIFVKKSIHQHMMHDSLVTTKIIGLFDLPKVSYTNKSTKNVSKSDLAIDFCSTTAKNT